jgi:hypothetical protein
MTIKYACRTRIKDENAEKLLALDSGIIPRFKINSSKFVIILARLFTFISIITILLNKLINCKYKLERRPKPTPFEGNCGIWISNSHLKSKTSSQC